MPRVAIPHWLSLQTIPASSVGWTGGFRLRLIRTKGKGTWARSLLTEPAVGNSKKHNCFIGAANTSTDLIMPSFEYKISKSYSRLQFRTDECLTTGPVCWWEGFGGTNIAGEFLLLPRRADRDGPEWLQLGFCCCSQPGSVPALPKTSLHLFLQALQGDIKHRQAVVTFELLSQCSASLQVCWGVRHPQPSRDDDIPASDAKFSVDFPCCLCSDLVCWNEGTDRKQHSLFAVQGQLLESIAAGCQQDKIQQDSRED